MLGGEGGARYGRIRTHGKTVLKKYLYPTVQLHSEIPALMKPFYPLLRSYWPEVFIFIIFCCWSASIYFGVKSYLLSAEAAAIDANRPAPVFHWGRYLPGLFFLLYFVGIRLRQRRSFK